ncbi:MAG: AAA family ATPase [Sandaracinus sp.]|nr:AAA family ATPase [Sandaracinus sp.]MCB9636664.1 AAA family ATPase [Sandaracinus sp.]
MEVLLLMGLQATGKSSFYRERFFRTHVRISLDLLRTRARERAFFETGLRTGQRLVIDNTNPRREDRARYVVPARAAGFRVTGFWFASSIAASLVRNRERRGDERVPDVGVLGTHARLEPPSLDEGFDALFFVRAHDGRFEVDAWRDA